VPGAHYEWIDVPEEESSKVASSVTRGSVICQLTAFALGDDSLVSYARYALFPAYWGDIQTSFGLNPTASGQLMNDSEFYKVRVMYRS
jgi:hypothetical protein